MERDKTQMERAGGSRTRLGPDGGGGGASNQSKDAFPGAELLS